VPEDVVLYEVAERVATVTINRPEARNAMTEAVREGMWSSFLRAEDDPEVDVAILTGADPAFCAGMDLHELANRPKRPFNDHTDPTLRRFVPYMTKPVIAAVNGACVTGGLELALQCSFIIASDRARFADTHARVGVMPWGGMTVFLPQVVGIRMAREMSLTGNYIDATEAHRLGLANHVIPHEELMPFTRKIAADIVSADQVGARQLLATYDATSSTTIAEGLRHEALAALRWQPDGAEIAARLDAILSRGRSQTS
jgi:enoyl-CoA hydratase